MNKEWLWPIALGGAVVAVGYLLNKRQTYPPLIDSELGAEQMPYPDPDASYVMSDEEMLSLDFSELEEPSQHVGAVNLPTLSLASSRVPYCSTTTGCGTNYVKNLIIPSVMKTIAVSLYASSNYQLAPAVSACTAYVGRIVKYVSDSQICSGKPECFHNASWIWKMRVGTGDERAVLLASLLRNYSATSNVVVGYVKGPIGNTGKTWGSGATKKVCACISMNHAWYIADAMVPIVFPLSSASYYGYYNLYQYAR
jgi:hypothetical protein